MAEMIAATDADGVVLDTEGRYIILVRGSDRLRHGLQRCLQCVLQREK
ncbi:MAG: hypothetical protein U5L72_19715 [Bacteroidales bacterium]|nr:hypothetical protein [Bacteroidales bacterium]